MGYKNPLLCQGTLNLLTMKYVLLCFSIFLLICCKPKIMNHRNTALTATEQQARSPQEVFEQLQAGNVRYMNGTPDQVDASALRGDTVDGQHPKAVVLSCIDSRVPVEMLFDQHIGDIFVARVAGNFENPDILGSMEYACAVAGSKLIVVLGHAGCGAVKAACDGGEMGHITEDKDFVNATIAENVRLTMGRILEKSSILNDLHKAGTIDVVGGVYQLDSGEVTWLD